MSTTQDGAHAWSAYYTLITEREMIAHAVLTAELENAIDRQNLICAALSLMNLSRTKNHTTESCGVPSNMASIRANGRFCEA